MKWPVRTQNLGMLLLGAWLIATGVSPFVHVTAVSTGNVLSVLAIVAGGLILSGR